MFMDITPPSTPSPWAAASSSEAAFMPLHSASFGDGGDNAHQAPPSATPDFAAMMRKACVDADLNLIQKLAKADASLLATHDSARNTLLHIAVDSSSSSSSSSSSASSEQAIRVVDLLLSLRLDLSAVNKRGCTPLHIAASKGDLAMVTHLLSKAGCPKLVRNRDGMTPLTMADHAKHFNVVEAMLSQEGVSVSVLSPAKLDADICLPVDPQNGVSLSPLIELASAIARDSATPLSMLRRMCRERGIEENRALIEEEKSEEPGEDLEERMRASLTSRLEFYYKKQLPNYERHYIEKEDLAERVDVKEWTSYQKPGKPSRCRYLDMLIACDDYKAGLEQKASDEEAASCTGSAAADLFYCRLVERTKLRFAPNGMAHTIAYDSSPMFGPCDDADGGLSSSFSRSIDECPMPRGIMDHHYPKYLHLWDTEAATPPPPSPGPTTRRRRAAAQLHRAAASTASDSSSSAEATSEDSTPQKRKRKVASSSSTARKKKVATSAARKSLARQKSDSSSSSSTSSNSSSSSSGSVARKKQKRAVPSNSPDSDSDPLSSDEDVPLQPPKRSRTVSTSSNNRKRVRTSSASRGRSRGRSTAPTPATPSSTAVPADGNSNSSGDGAAPNSLTVRLDQHAQQNNSSSSSSSSSAVASSSTGASSSTKSSSSIGQKGVKSTKAPKKRARTREVSQSRANSRTSNKRQKTSAPNKRSRSSSMHPATPATSGVLSPTYPHPPMSRTTSTDSKSGGDDSTSAGAPQRGDSVMSEVFTSPPNSRQKRSSVSRSRSIARRASPLSAPSADGGDTASSTSSSPTHGHARLVRGDSEFSQRSLFRAPQSVQQQNGREFPNGFTPTQQGATLAAKGGGLTPRDLEDLVAKTVGSNVSPAERDLLLARAQRMSTSRPRESPRADNAQPGDSVSPSRIGPVPQSNGMPQSANSQSSRSFSRSRSRSVARTPANGGRGPMSPNMPLASHRSYSQMNGAPMRASSAMGGLNGASMGALNGATMGPLSQAGGGLNGAAAGGAPDPRSELSRLLAAQAQQQQQQQGNGGALSIREQMAVYARANTNRPGTNRLSMEQMQLMHMQMQQEQQLQHQQNQQQQQQQRQQRQQHLLIGLGKDIYRMGMLRRQGDPHYNEAEHKGLMAKAQALPPPMKAIVEKTVQALQQRRQLQEQQQQQQQQQQAQEQANQASMMRFLQQQQQQQQQQHRKDQVAAAIERQRMQQQQAARAQAAASMLSHQQHPHQAYPFAQQF